MQRDLHTLPGQSKATPPGEFVTADDTRDVAKMTTQPAGSPAGILRSH